MHSLELQIQQFGLGFVRAGSRRCVLRLFTTPVLDWQEHALTAAQAHCTQSR